MATILGIPLADAPVAELVQRALACGFVGKYEDQHYPTDHPEPALRGSVFVQSSMG